MSTKTRIVMMAVCAGAVLAFGLAGAGATPPRSEVPAAAHLAIDADTTNGGGPCDPMDAQRLGAPTSGTYTVAICLVDGEGAPDAWEATVVWSGGVATPPEIPDAGAALDDNPDFNDGPAPLGFGPDWSCSPFTITAPAGDNPATGAADAHIVCYDLHPGTVSASPALLATLAMTADGAGTETFEFSVDGSSSVNSPAGENRTCGPDLGCAGGLVVQGDGPPITATPGAETTPTVMPAPPPPAPTPDPGAPVPYIAIDADTTNGAGPCDPIDAQRLGAPTSGTYTIAVCLVDSQGPPDAWEADVIWSGGVAAPPELPDIGDALDDNPDFNDAAGPLGSGTNWSCNAFGLAYPAGDNPNMPATDAHIFCYERAFRAGTLAASPGILAIITMTADGAGTETFEFSVDGSSGVNSPAGYNRICGFDLACPGAVVVQGP